MHLDIQVQPDGTLRFVDPTGRTVVTLDQQHLLLLLSLAGPHAKPVLKELPVVGYDRLVTAKKQLVRGPLAPVTTLSFERRWVTCRPPTERSPRYGATSNVQIGAPPYARGEVNLCIEIAPDVDICYCVRRLFRLCKESRWQRRFNSLVSPPGCWSSCWCCSM